MNMNKLGTMFVSILICGCSQVEDKCAHFPSAYVRSNITLSNFEKAPIAQPEIRMALATIRKCYQRNRYIGFDNSLKIRQALKHRGDRYLIVAELDGVSDLLLVFEIDRNGSVISSYQKSTL
jgi:hypothetical protein